ncbi:hypothetical protein BRARA_I00631 [Brassica rapa]|uniref:G patch domain-containing protein n=1 Tax=Brassica campestris TaxID=3711 RepID=A0A397XRG1_BRACM|nr:hypothetical protein BRARA_I00631 [Brassica rapa]
MGLEEDDFVFHGTPIEREEEIGSRKKKAVAGASGNLRTLPAWKQEVTDEEGRRRFHGAFTGGYSAGYYNTVGSKEGWAPQSFTSSRKNRAGARKQNISDFLDEDEKAELEGQSLSASSQFDTFGFTAAEHSRKQAEKEHHERPSAIPGPVHDELIAPVSESIGVKLLLKMGWRRGHSIKDVRAGSDARREARKAFLAFSADENTKESSDSLVLETEVKTSLDPQINEDTKFSETTPVYVLNPKQDLHDDEEQQPMNGKRQEGQEKKNEAAAATTLNRLIAGDFLESLGKELGFEVPSDVTYPEGTKPMEEDNKSKRKSDAASERRPATKEKPEEKTSGLKLRSEEETDTKKREKSPRNWSGEEKSTKKREESPRNDLSSSDSSGDERRRKRSKKDRHRNNDTESDSSSDYHSRDKRSSRSRRKRRESSREKRSSHKKHHTKHYKTNDSSSRYSMDEDRKESRLEKRRHRD